MPESTLRELLDRAEKDEEFQTKLVQDPQAAHDEFDLSITERTALMEGDDDALRRLAGIEVEAFTNRGYNPPRRSDSGRAGNMGARGQQMGPEWGPYYTHDTYTGNQGRNGQSCLHHPC